MLHYAILCHVFWHAATGHWHVQMGCTHHPHSAMRSLALLLLLVALLWSPAHAQAVKNFLALGGVPDDASLSAMKHNSLLFNETVAALQPGDVFLIPNTTFYMLGGIVAEDVRDVVFQIDGTLSFSNDRATHPKNPNGSVMELMNFDRFSNVTFTSGGHGIFDGNGSAWWGVINFMIHGEDRPRLFVLSNSKNILVEHLLFKNSPYWSFWAPNSNGLTIRYSEVDARVTNQSVHTLEDLTAFNTDGFDITGQNVYIHDCRIWNQDDCISVKDGSRDMLFERISCSGLGLVIGSIGASKVQNITFRDCHLPNTFKGIYMKTRWSDSGPIGDAASISDILYENIYMDQPEQYAIWIGPAQQTGNPCSLLWPLPGEKCEMSAFQTWSNITLRNVQVNKPLGSPGVLIGNSSNPIQNLVFDNVNIIQPGWLPFGVNYYCDSLPGVAIDGTMPVPTCFKKN